MNRRLAVPVIAGVVALGAPAAVASAATATAGSHVQNVYLHTGPNDPGQPGVYLHTVPCFCFKNTVADGSGGGDVYMHT